MEKKLQLRNSIAEFLIFTGQAGEQSIEARTRIKLSCPQDTKRGRK